ncbi:MAG: hypothetical protein DRG09_01250 [Epsilonproteobacteria bacterium]|nr:MAG: hypothetical protein DRG09_01250 [Campylobacterota bacterium]
MSMVKYILTLCMVIWLALVILMPKEELYYKLEETLHSQEIALNEEVIDEGLFGLSLKNVSVYVKGINVANIEEVNLFTILFYSYIEVKGLRIDDSLKTMVPQETQKAVLEHSVMAPFSVSVEAEGSFGTMDGKIDLNERKVHLDFNESKNIAMLKPQLKKNEKGWVYETSF